MANYGRTAMISLPVFPVNTPEAFYELLIASKPDPATSKPDPTKMEAFLARHPETVKALTVIKGQPVSSGFGNSTFHGLNAFRFINSAGDSIPVRWLMTPMQPFEAASTASVPQDKNYLFDALIAAIHRQPLQWRLIIIIGQPDDPTNDASVPWPGRQQVDVGTLTLDRVESDETSAATDLNFDPLVLPAGITPADDPLLSARSAVYSQSFRRRAGETKQPTAITPADVRKGD
jgi:catalase